jgi:gliding motility-associated peptidyl-prolyl isomerase
MIKHFTLIIFILSLISCKTPELREPLNKNRQYSTQKQDDAYQNTMAKEQALFKKIREANPKRKFINSGSGFWYYYLHQVKENTPLPKYSDKVNFRYEVYSIKGDTIYSEKELGKRVYYVEQQALMQGLKDGIKLLKKGESARFFFPSFKAYGVHGDEKKINKPNIPLICKITIDGINEE